MAQFQGRTNRSDTGRIKHQNISERNRLPEINFIQRLGVGSSGTVYATADPTIAVKIFEYKGGIEEEVTANKTFKKKIDDPKVLTKHTLFHEKSFEITKFPDNQQCIIYRRCYGPSLKELLYGKMNIYDLKQCLESTYECMVNLLNPLWKRNIYHCDIKPDNMMFCNNVVKLIDLGSLMRKGECFGVSPVFIPTTRLHVKLRMYMENKNIEINDSNLNQVVKRTIKDVYNVILSDEQIKQLGSYRHINNDRYACCMTLFILLDFIKSKGSSDNDFEKWCDNWDSIIGDCLASKEDQLINKNKVSRS